MRGAYLSPCVAKDDGLSDRKSVVQVAKGVEFPVFLFYGDEELLDALKRQFVTLDENADGVSHELGCHLEHIVREGSAEKDNLGCGGEVPVNVVDLVLEALVEKLVSLVQDEHFDISCSKAPTANHVEHTARGS